MALEYGLKIRTERIEELSSILQVNPSNTAYGWELWVDEGHFSYSESVNYFLSLLDKHFFEMQNIGILKEDITLWIYYEYEQQCNFEFHPKELKRISDFGIVLCISCWEKDTTIEF